MCSESESRGEMKQQHLQNPRASAQGRFSKPVTVKRIPPSLPCKQYVWSHVYVKLIRDQVAAMGAWIYYDDCTAHGPLAQHRSAFWGNR